MSDYMGGFETDPSIPYYGALSDFERGVSLEVVAEMGGELSGLLELDVPTIETSPPPTPPEPTSKYIPFDFGPDTDADRYADNGFVSPGLARRLQNERRSA